MSEHKVEGKHSTCPRCGSRDTCQADNAEATDSSAHFLMECDGCGETYQSVFYPVYQFFQDEED